MRTTSTAWAAALAIMSVRGPFTTAEAAPARQYEGERPRHYFPKHLRRGGYNHSTPAVESTSSSSFEPDLSSVDSSTSEPPITPDSSLAYSNTRRTRSSTQTSQSYDDAALVESLIEAGRLPETANTIVTTTLTVAFNAERTATYTLTYTETSSPVPNGRPYPTSQAPVPLTSSSSIPVPVGTAPDTHHKPKHGHLKATISTRGTSTNQLGSLVPSTPVPLNSHPTIDSRTYHHHHQNTTTPAPSISSLPPSPPSSSVPLSSSSAAGLLGHLLPSESAESLPVPHVHGTNHLLPSSGGIIPPSQPVPTPPSQSYVPIESSSSSSDGGLLLGLSSAIPNILGTDSSQSGQPTKTKQGGLLSDLGVSGLPTGVSYPTQSVLPTGALNGKPSDSSSSQGPGLLGVTDSLTNLGGTVTNLVGTLTGGVDTAVSQVTPDLSSLVSSAKHGLSHLAGTATNLVGTATNIVGPVVTDATDTAGPVGTVTNLAGTVTNLAGTVTNLAGTVTNLAGTVTNLAGTVTNLAGTVTNLAGTVTNEVNSLTNTPGITVPSGAYTITGGGATLTVPIPTSIGTSIPITPPTQVTVPSGTAPGGYTITVPSGASSILSSLTSASPTETISTVPDSVSSYPTSVPLTGSTKLTLASSTPSSSTPSAYPTKSTTESSAVPAASSSSVAPETNTHTKAPQTIKPTGTNSLTSMTFPTSWKFAPTSWSTTTKGLSTATAGTDTAITGLPTYMPRLVQPPDGMPIAPVNSTLIQLGFNYGLNYPFVVGEPDSAGQIFAYMPQGLAYGLGISEKDIKMNALMPYDTSSSLTYITTLAQAYIPSQLVDTLEMSIHMPLSEIYQNPDSPVRTLMSMINPTIPILPGAALEGASSSAYYNPAATSTNGPGAGAPLGGDSGSTNHVTTSTLGIGMGAVGGAAVYAAAMVYIARRYKQRRQGHQRASSVHTTGEMSQRSGGMANFFMSGANGAGTGSGGRGSRTSAGSSNGRSVREQGISGPIMAENSLGWN